MPKTTVRGRDSSLKRRLRSPGCEASDAIRSNSAESEPRERGAEPQAGPHASCSASIAGNRGEMIMLWGLVAILVVLWALGFLAFHVGGALIHVLLVIAVIVVIVNIVRGRGARL